MVDKSMACPNCMNDIVSTYCPGCGHGVVHRIIGSVIDELGLKDKTILVAPIGCAGSVAAYYDFDSVKGNHGRAPAVATGIKRTNPDKIVFTYQGDGDLASIGAAEILHAAARGDCFTVIFVNNAIYGMTGGQMAPTTLVGQISNTTPEGRMVERAGYPIDMTKILSGIDGVAFAARGSVSNPKNIRKTQELIKRAFQTQIDNQGLSIVEVLSRCPVNWNMSPVKADEWIENILAERYPLGVLKAPGMEENL